MCQMAKLIVLSIGLLTGVPVNAKEIIMNCGSTAYPWVFKYEEGFFADEVYVRQNSQWLKACTIESIVILHEVTDISKTVTDGGLLCDYRFKKKDGSTGGTFMNLDFITLTYDHFGTGKCSKMN